MDHLAYQRNSVVPKSSNASGSTLQAKDSNLSTEEMSIIKVPRRRLLVHVPWVLRFITVLVAVIVATAVVYSYSSVGTKVTLSQDEEGELDFDLPYLLNVTAFIATSQVAPASALERAAKMNDQSVAAAYLRLPRRCPTRPRAVDLKEAFKSIAMKTVKRGGKRERERAKAIKLAEQLDTLTVQLELNGSEVNSVIAEHIAKRAADFRYVLLVPPPRKSLSFDSRAMEDMTQQATQAARYAGAQVEVFRGGPGMSGADDDALVLYSASNLVVFDGPRGALAALTSSGQVELGWNRGLNDFMAVDAFRWAVPNLGGSKPHQLSPSALLALNGMGNVSESCCEFEPFGTGDGAKIVCSNAHEFARPPCWVLSLGCGNRWSFETDIIRRTECKVQIFDCTGDFKVPTELQERVTLHKLCVGHSSDEGGAHDLYRSWNDILAIGASHSGFPEDSMPTLAKIDVEGWELPTFFALTSDERLMPEQIVVELHVNTKVKVGHPYIEDSASPGRFQASRDVFAEVFTNLSDAGYYLVHRADNPFCGHCSEVTLLHRVAMPQLASRCNATTGMCYR